MTAESRTLIGDATLTASGIARLAGVGRAAVSNWRRRYADFPPPVGGTPASPHFNAREVDEWLRRQGKLRQAGAAHWAWRHIETYQPAAQIGQVLGIVGAYLLARSEQASPGGEPLTPKQLAARLRAIDDGLAKSVREVVPDHWDAKLRMVLQVVDQLADEQDPEAAFEYLHGQYVSSAQSLSGLASTPESVAEVMLMLAGTGASTFDFTCGTGSILRVAAERALLKGTATHCHAQEIKAEYALIATVRLWFVHRRSARTGHPTGPAPVLRVGDSLLADAFPGLRADVVVANFPFGIHNWGHDQLVYDPRWVYGLPPRTEPELAWVQHALAHLAAGGTAVLLMPPAAATRAAGRRIRAELIRSGALRAIVALPAGLMPPQGVGLHVWVLTEPSADRAPDARILFVDASGAERMTEVIGTAWRAFESGDHRELSGVHRAVPVIDLLDERVDLTPQRHLLIREQAGDASHTIARVNELNRLTTALRDGVPDVRLAPKTTVLTVPRASLADLVRSKSMSIERASTRASPPGTTDGGEGSFPAPRVAVGDVVLSVVGSEIAARVVTTEQAGVELAPGTHLVRVDPSQFDPWFVAGALSQTDDHRATARASGTGSGFARIDLRRCTIPVLSLSEQRAYGKVFRQLVEFQATLEGAMTLGAALIRELRAGLASGMLVPAAR